jgi:hypothetical protein
MDETNIFLNLLIAAMQDAVLTGHISQLQTTITPEGTSKAKLLRIIVVPEEMEIVRPLGGEFKRPL